MDKIHAHTPLKAMKKKNCPKCGSKNTKKNGKEQGKQQYYCKQYHKQFLSGKRINNQQLWREYTTEKQTYQQLATKYQCSIRTIQRHLDKAEPTRKTNTITKANIIMDTIYFGRNFALMVFMDNKTKIVLDYKIIK